MFRPGHLLGIACCIVGLSACSSSTTSAPTPGASTLAVVRTGAAVLAEESLTGGTPGQAISLTGAPSTVLSSPNGTKAFVLDSTNAQVTPVDLSSGHAAAPIQIGKLPTDEHFSADGKTLYVTDNLDGALVPIDVATERARAAIHIGDGIDFFVPSPDGATGLLGTYTPQGQPGSVEFFSLTAGPLAVGSVGSNAANTAVYSPDGKTVWVLESGIGNLPGVVIPVDVATHEAGAGITVGHSPSDIAITPDGSKLLVTNALDAAVTVINTASRTVAATVTVGAIPASVRISADGNTAWVACELGRNLSSIDLRTLSTAATVTLTNNPTSLALDATAANAWVMFPASDGNIVTVGHQNQLSRPINVGNGSDLDISQDGNTAWVANSLSDTVQEVNLQNGTAKKPIPVPRDPSIGYLSRDHKTLYVLSFGDGTKTGYLTAINTAAYKSGAPIPVGVAPSGIEVSKDEHLAYVSFHESNAVKVFDLRNDEQVGNVALSCSPSDLVLNSDNSKLFVTCADDQKIVPILLPSYSEDPPIAVCGRPGVVLNHAKTVLLIFCIGGLLEVDTKTEAVKNTQNITSNLTSMWFSPDDKTIIGLDNSGGQVATFNASNLQTLKTVSLGGRPDGMEVSLDGSRAYVLDSVKQQLAIISISTMKVLSRISVSPNAYSVVVPEPDY